MTDQKTAQVSASQKDSPGASILESDQESQQTQGYDNGTFQVKEGHEYYRPIDSYEGMHRWDPGFEWTEEEEKNIVRKVKKSHKAMASQSLTWS